MIDDENPQDENSEDINILPELKEPEILIPDLIDSENEEREEEIAPEVLPTFQDIVNNNYGRPSKYDESMPEKLFNYFFQTRMEERKRKSTYHGRQITKVYYVARRKPTREGFCAEQCIGTTTFERWIKEHEEFRGTYEICKARAKDVLVQNILDGEWGVKAGAFMAINFTDMIDQRPKDEVPDDGLGGVEVTPKRVKGYNLAEIDKYCSKPDIETTAKEVKDGKEESVQVSQETKNI